MGGDTRAEEAVLDPKFVKLKIREKLEAEEGQGRKQRTGKEAKRKNMDGQEVGV